MGRRSLLLLAAFTLAALAAEAQITRIPGYYGRIFSDVEGFAYGSQRPLDTDAPRGPGWNAAGIVLSEDDFDAFGLSFGYGTSTGRNPWRADVAFQRVSPDGGEGVNGFGVSGAYQLYAQEGLYAVNVSGSVELVDDAYDLFGAAINGEIRVPNTEISFGGSLGIASIDFDFGASESDVVGAIEGIYTFREYGFAISGVYQLDSDITDGGGGLTATWALPRTFPIPNSNVRFGVIDETLFVRYRTRF